MNLLLLKEKIYSNISYEELVYSLKKLTGKNCAFGFIDREELSIYYFKNWYTEKLKHGGVPTCNVRAKNSVDEHGRLLIEFKIATHFLIFLFSCPIFFVSAMYFGTNDFFLYPLFLYPVIYFGLIFYLIQQSGRFKKDLNIGQGI